MMKHNRKKHNNAIAIAYCLIILLVTPILFDLSLLWCHVSLIISNLMMPAILSLLFVLFYFVVRGLQKYRLWIGAYILTSFFGIVVRLMIAPPRWLDYYPTFPEISLILSAIAYVVIGVIFIFVLPKKVSVQNEKT